MLEFVIVCLLVAAFSWLPFAALCARIFGKKNARRIHFWAVIVYLATASATVYAVGAIQSEDSRFWQFDSALDFLVIPLISVGILIDYNLWAGLLMTVFGFGVCHYAARHMAHRKALLAAFFTGLIAPPLGVAGQNFLIAREMDRGASDLNVDCVEKRPLYEIVQNAARTQGRFFTDFHALSRRGDEVWIWSFQQAAWVAYDPQDRNGHLVDPLGQITCPK